MGECVVPSWENLPERIKSAWRAAIAVAIDSPAKTHAMTDVTMRMISESEVVKLGRLLKANIAPDRGFILFILFAVNCGDGGTLAYVATVDRDDAIRTLREWLKRQGAL